MSTPPPPGDDAVPPPLPDSSDELFAPHFRGLEDGRLLVQRCTQCAHLQWPPREICLRCRHEELSWTELPGEGIVYTYTVSHRAFHPAFASSLPMSIAVVEVAPGVRVLGEFGGDLASLRCGDRVVAGSRRVADTTLLRWQPAEPR